MGKAIVLFFLFALLFSCNSQLDNMRIPSEVMVQVLADVHLTEGAILSIRPLEKDSFRKLYYKQIYEIHEITAEDFEKDIATLKKNPKMMERLYEKVLEELNRKEAELQGKSLETKK